jgi:serine/threonine protein phosphatase PrpC
LSLQFALQQGDVVVMASDGLFDNVWDEQVRGQDNSWICDSVWDEQECIA